MSKFDQRVVQQACDFLIYKYLVENGHLKTAELLKKKRKRKYNLNVKKDERISEKFSFMITKYAQLKSSSTGKSLSEALFFAAYWENMLCTKIVLNVRNNLCTQHVLPRFELGIFMY